jgi:hypothetical protein
MCVMLVPLLSIASAIRVSTKMGLEYASHTFAHASRSAGRLSTPKLTHLVCAIMDFQKVRLWL